MRWIGDAVPSRCPNCSAELTDDYCGTCGQRRIHPQDLSARHFVRELADEIANLDSKFKIVRSLRGLLTPGFLTEEYLAGRRQAHLNPIKLYLVCAAIFFLAAPAAGFKLASMVDEDPSGALSRLVSARVAARGLDPSLFSARFDIRVQSVYTISLGAGAIVIALLLQLLFRKQAKPYGAHLIFALHYVSFMYLITVAAGAGRVMGAPAGAAVLAAFALIVPYLILALKRVYREANGLILLKAGALLLLTLEVNNLASRAAIQLTLALV
jgi:hypothetical protein